MSTVTEMAMGAKGDARLELLSPEELERVQGGVRLVEVKVDGHSTGVVDWDELQWDIFTGNIKVTYK